MAFSVAIQEQDFDVGAEYAQLVEGDKNAGAVVFFVGRVREFSQDHSVTGLALEYYPGMTEKVLEKLITQARQRWELNAVRIVHRVGSLGLMDQIVFVGVVSRHREQAFLAAEYLMDFLKTQAPFWKKETREEGSVWVEANAKDTRACERWQF